MVRSECKGVRESGDRNYTQVWSYVKYVPQK